jgi:uncharacterized protein (DUF2267 family)
MDNADHKRLQM